MKAKLSLVLAIAAILVFGLLAALSSSSSVQAEESATPTAVLVLSSYEPWSPGEVRHLMLVVKGPVSTTFHVDFMNIYLKGASAKDSEPGVTTAVFEWDVQLWDDVPVGWFEFEAYVTCEGCGAVIRSNTVRVQVPSSFETKIAWAQQGWTTWSARANPNEVVKYATYWILPGMVPGGGAVEVGSTWLTRTFSANPSHIYGVGSIQISQAADQYSFLRSDWDYRVCAQGPAFIYRRAVGEANDHVYVEVSNTTTQTLKVVTAANPQLTLESGQTSGYEFGPNSQGFVVLLDDANRECGLLSWRQPGVVTDLSLEVSPADSAVTLGDWITHTVTVTNRGPDAGEIEGKLPVPWNMGGGDAIFGGLIEAGSSKSFSYAFKPQIVASYEVTATVKLAYGVDPNPANDSQQVRLAVLREVFEAHYSYLPLLQR